MKGTTIADSSIERLPYEIITRTCFFLDLPSRVQVASCSKTLQSLVFGECFLLWQEIDFEHAPESCGAKIDDFSLWRLLKRVNAKEVTRALSLCGCENITHGFCLRPLEHSRVLERIDLRVGKEHKNQPGHSCLDNEAVLGVLKTILPFKLFDVKFRTQNNGDYLSVFFDKNVDAFLMDLQRSNIQKAYDQKIRCTSCSVPVVSEEDIGTKTEPLMALRCATCNQHFCRHNNGNCQVTLRKCSGYYCKPYGLAHCSNCHDTRECEQCLRTCCDFCNPLANCAFCGKLSCDDCGNFKCEGCGLYSCNECDKVSYCESCNSTFCKSCRNIMYCETCGTYLCDGCGGACCVTCESTCCKNCSKSCVDCSKIECDNCNEEIKYCDSCSNHFCNVCGPTEWSEESGLGQVCKGCQECDCPPPLLDEMRILPRSSTL